MDAFATFVVLIAFLVSVAFIIGAGIVMVKHQDQQRHDRQRVTYRLVFPGDLSADMQARWLWSLSGTLRSTNHRFVGLPTVALETVASNEGIIHRLKVPWPNADYVIGQLNYMVPGIRVTPEKHVPRETWNRMVEVGMTHDTRPLAMHSADQLAHSLLASVSPLDIDEAVIIQWVISPAIPTALPVYKQSASDRFSARWLTQGNLAGRDEIKERRAKLAEPNMLAVLRVGSRASTKGRAKRLINNVRGSMAQARGPHVRFTKQWVPRSVLQDRIDHSRTSVFFPMRLSISELVPLLSWPINNPMIPGLPMATTRFLPAPAMVPEKDGILIGRSTFPTNERKIALGYKDALTHFYAVGSTGVGKSQLLANMSRQIMRDGYGLILMEREGDLFNKVLDYVPRERVKDVIILDASDASRPVGFNLLDQIDSSTAIDSIIALFQHRYGQRVSGLWTDEYLLHGLSVIAENPMLSFLDIIPLLNPMTTEEEHWADAITRQIKDDEEMRWWQRHENRGKIAQQQRADPVLSRMSQLVSRKEIRYVMGQSKSSFQLADVLRDNKILLISFKGVSKEPASLMGTLILNILWPLITAVKKAKPIYLVLDEFADFMDLAIDTESMLAQARKHNVGLILANQHLAQLKASVKDAVLTNARSKVVFRSNADDGRALSKEMGGRIQLNESDFTSLGIYQAIAQLETPAGSSPPMTLQTLAPRPSTGVASEVRRLSREKYGRPIAEVQAEMQARHRLPDAPSSRPRPRISGSSWGT